LQATKKEASLSVYIERKASRYLGMQWELTTIIPYQLHKKIKFACYSL
jgi:hypothetical protein